MCLNDASDKCGALPGDRLLVMIERRHMVGVAGHDLALFNRMQMLQTIVRIGGRNHMVISGAGESVLGQYSDIFPMLLAISLPNQHV
jgi:hypothetical protein